MGEVGGGERGRLFTCFLVSLPSSLFFFPNSSANDTLPFLPFFPFLEFAFLSAIVVKEGEAERRGGRGEGVGSMGEGERGGPGGESTASGGGVGGRRRGGIKVRVWRRGECVDCEHVGLKL